MARRNMDLNVQQRLVGYYTLSDGMRLWVPPSEQFIMKTLPAEVDPFLSSATQEFPLGTELYYAERKFRYAKSGASVVPVANLVQAVVPLAGHIDEVVNSAAADATTIDFTPNTVTTDDMAANEFADGYLHINDDTGEGYMYRIRSHPAIVGGTSGTITLYDKILLTLGADATATIIHAPYRGFIIHPSPPTAKVLGVTVIPSVANEFCWLQYQGPCAVLTQGTLVIADSCVPSATVDGAVMPSAAFETDGPVIGEVLAVNATGEHSPIWLAIP